MKHPMTKTISATYAARRFSDVLDEVEYRGTVFNVERHGKRVATILPFRPTARGLTWSEWLERRRRGPQVDAQFAADLREIRRSQGDLPKTNPWERSSTRRP